MSMSKLPNIVEILREDSGTYLSSERYHMMLAQRKDLDIFDNDELIMIFVEDSPIDQIPDVLLIAFRKVEHGFCIALRRPSQTLPGWVLSYTLQDGRYSSFQSLQPFLRLLRCCFQTLSRPKT